jgi:DNA recombination protein RmuC
MDLVVVLLIGVGVGAVAGFVVGRSRAGGDNLDVLRARHTAEILEVRHAEAQEKAHLQADLAQAQAMAGELREQVSQFREQRQRELAEREKSQGDESKVLQQMAPIAKNLADMQRKVAEIEQQRAAQHSEIAEQIKATRETAEKSKAAAEMLNSALRNNQQRGAYGEMQLKNIVEAAGLLRRVDFATQESITADSGARRPDMVVKLPGGKEMAVDAKVPYTAYIESCRDDLDDNQRATLRKEHAKQVKAHVNALADKSYFTGLKTSPEYTIAFIPTDAILDAALDADGTLMDYAFSRGVALATPVNLFAVLKTVAFTWKQDDIAEGAREVVEMGQELFRRLRKTAENAAKLGRSIDSVVKNYNSFAGSLERSVLPQARRFDDLDIPEVPQLDADTRRFTAPEFTALDELDDVARPELEFVDAEADEAGHEEQTA